MSDNVVVFRRASLTVSAFRAVVVSVTRPVAVVAVADATSHGIVAHAFAPHITEPPTQELTHPSGIFRHHWDMARAHPIGKTLHQAASLGMVLAG